MAYFVVNQAAIRAEIMKVFQNPLQLIGNTPLLQLTRLVTSKNARVYMKLEMCNLTGSVKDRAAKYLIESAEKKGLIDLLRIRFVMKPR